MFQLIKKQFHNTPAYSFTHSDERYGLLILPSKGATIVDVTIKGKSILDGYQSEKEIKEHFYFKGEILAPFPNRIKDGTYQWNDKTYQFPINNPASQSALHGFVYDKPFEVIQTDCTDQSCSIRLLYTYKGDQEPFPFPFELELTYTLDIETGFQLDYQILNTGTTAMPAGFGWHPYFTFGNKINEVALKLPEVEQIEVDPFLSPTGKRSSFDGFKSLKRIDDYQFDTCFELINAQKNRRAEVILQNENQQINYWQKTGKGQFNFIQLFIPSNRSSIAIEPMTCNINAFNNKEGLVVLRPKEKMNSSCGVHYDENLF